MGQQIVCKQIKGQTCIVTQRLTTTECNPPDLKEKVHSQRNISPFPTHHQHNVYTLIIGRGEIIHYVL